MFIHNNSQFQHMISFKHLDFTHIEPKIILKMFVESWTKDCTQVH